LRQRIQQRRKLSPSDRSCAEDQTFENHTTSCPWTPKEDGGELGGRSAASAKEEEKRPGLKLIKTFGDSARKSVWHFAATQCKGETSIGEVSGLSVNKNKGVL